MAGQQPGGHGGVDGTGGQGGCAGDEAIHQGRHALCRAFQIEAGHGGDFQPAQFGQYLCAAQRLSLQALQRLCHHAALVGQSGVVDAGATTDHQLNLKIGQAADQGRRRGGIANAHVTGDQQIGPLFDGAARGGAADFQRGSTLFCSHGGFHCQVGGAGGYLGVHDGQFRQLTQHAHIHHFQPGGNGTGQYADGGTAGGEVLHHFAGHDGWVGRYAFGSHAVVAGKHGNGRRQRGRNGLPLPGGKAAGHRLQHAQAAGRLGQRVLALQGSLIRSVGGQGDGLGHDALFSGLAWTSAGL